MKQLLLTFCILTSLTCLAQNRPGNTVPQELITDEKTYWTISTLSTLYYVNTQPGAYYGTTTSGGGMIVQFKFLPNNRFRFQLYVESNMYSSRLQSWTEVEGSVVFTKDDKGQDIFITKAEKGVYRMYRNGTASNRPITADELERQHSSRFLWQKTKLKDDAKNVYLLMIDLKQHPDADVHNPKAIDPSWVSKFHIPA